MSQTILQLSAHQMVSRALARQSRTPVLKASVGFLAAIESLFVKWQAKRLAEIPRERLHAQLMQDARSFAEIRKARN